MTLKAESEEFRLGRSRLIEHLRRSGIRNEAVLSAMSEVPRQIFMDEVLQENAYEDRPLPIGQHQTISQPYIVARMTEVLLQGKKCRTVLEVGTGSGYQTAVLAKLVDKVYSIERIKILFDLAKLRLEDLNIHNVELRYGDGYLGWSEAAPFQGIMVTAAPREIPENLLNQLDEGGRMVIPIGELGSQSLMLIERSGSDFSSRYLEAVSFVPLVPGKD